MKKVAIIQSINQANEIKNLVDAFILPIEHFSINYDKTFNLNEIKEIINTNKEIFISVNKNIHNKELEKLENLLIQIDKLNIKGIIFYDIAIINLKTKLKLKTDLVWAEEHLTTNYQTINYWHEKGCKYAYLSSELTKEEIDEISKNTKATLFLNVFGHLPMFTSRRHLVSNYLEYFNIKDKGKNKRIYKEEKHYPIKENTHGTTVFSDYVLNAVDIDFNIDYLVYNSYLIEEETFKEVLQGKSVLPSKHGFLFKETIYKVKNNE